MSNRVRFGFISGLLAGTAAVGMLGVMMGQSESGQRIGQADRIEITMSSDGTEGYLWKVDCGTGELEFISRCPGPSASRGLVVPMERVQRGVADAQGIP